MVTAELAVALPGLLLVLGLCLAAVQLGIDHVRCVDAAHAAARLGARGEPLEVVRSAAARVAPDGSAVAVSAVGRSVAVEVRAPAPALLGPLGGRLAASARSVARSEADP